MRFSNVKYSTNWQKFNISIMMGSVISPLIFVLIMEMLLHRTEDTTSKKSVSSMKAFMDDVTDFRVEITHEKLLKHLQELFMRAIMKIKPSKSHSLSINKGKYQEIEFAIDNNVIPTIREKKRKKSRLLLFPSSYWSLPVARSFKTIKRSITLHW